MEFLWTGLIDAVNPLSLAILAIGVLWGMVIGWLPGLGLVVAVTLALPFTYAMDISDSLLLLIGTAAGCQFGNGVTAITVGVPGSPSAVITVIEGYQMYRRGEGGAALLYNLLASVFGQVFGAIGFVILIVPLAAIAPRFLSPETFALTVFGLLAVATLTGSDRIKGAGALFLGLSLGFVGKDPVSGTLRFTFGVQELFIGLGIVPVTIGLLGLGEFLYQLYRRAEGFEEGAAERPRSARVREGRSLRVSAPWGSLLPLSVVAVFGGVVAFFVGIIPGLGATAASFIVYQQLKWVARRPEELGHGSAEGLVAQNAGDNAVVGGELVPTLGLGIPGSASMAVLMGALVIQGIQPGPNVLATQPELTGLVAAGLLLSALVLLPIGWAFSYSALRVASLWQPAIFGSGVLLILLGTYASSNRMFEVYEVIAFGVLGLLLRLNGFPVAATAIGFILSPLLEESFRHGILIELGSLWGFVTRPITGILLIFALLVILQQSGLIRRVRGTGRKETPPEKADSPE